MTSTTKKSKRNPKQIFRHEKKKNNPETKKMHRKNRLDKGAVKKSFKNINLRGAKDITRNLTKSQKSDLKKLQSQRRNVD